jgi:tetratricopeptide (TPR) repeat protein
MIPLMVSVLLILSCAGAPEPSPEPAPEPEPEPSPKAVETPEAPPPEALREEAADLREAIAEYELSQYAQPTFEEADEAYRRGIDLYGKDNEAATDALETAVEGFEDVRVTGFLELTAIRRNRVEEQMEAALDAKADVAAKDYYRDATESLSEADEAVENQEYAEALVLYDEALEDFAEATTVAKAKREEAERAMREAEESRRDLDSRVEELEDEAREELEGEEEEQ